jgi:hypothetical protein
VDVALLLLGRIEVHDHVDVVDVDPACGNIRRDEHRVVSGLEVA